MEGKVLIVDHSKQAEFITKIRHKENYKNLFDFYNLNISEISIEKIDLDKRTLLINSVVNKNFDAVKLMIELNSDVNNTDSVYIYL